MTPDNRKLIAPGTASTVPAHDQRHKEAADVPDLTRSGGWGDPLSTIRVAKRQRFTTVDQTTVNDDRLSFRARGVLVWLLDKPDDWRCDSEAIAAAGSEGRGAIRTALNELVECGYLHRLKYQGEKGRWYTEQVLTETPTSEVAFPVVGRPDVGGPNVGEPVAKRPKTDEPTTETKQALSRFPEFWLAYPKGTYKKDAQAQWVKEVKAGADPDDIIAGTVRYASSERVLAGYVMDPHRWLKAQRWKDEPRANDRDSRSKVRPLPKHTGNQGDLVEA